MDDGRPERSWASTRSSPSTMTRKVGHHRGFISGRDAELLRLHLARGADPEPDRVGVDGYSLEVVHRPGPGLHCRVRTLVVQDDGYPDRRCPRPPRPHHKPGILRLRFGWRVRQRKARETAAPAPIRAATCRCRDLPGKDRAAWKAGDEVGRTLDPHTLKSDLFPPLDERASPPFRENPCARG